MQNCVSNFLMEVDYSLRCGSSRKQVINVQFRHDCFHYLFSNCNKQKLYLNDFKPSYFPPGWDQCIKNYETQQNTSGIRVLFPIKVTSLYIKWMSKGHFLDNTGLIVKKATTFKEMIKFHVKKENF